MSAAAAPRAVRGGDRSLRSGRLDRLYAQLSRIALDLDDLALELAAVGLSFEEAEEMRVPAAHLLLAVDRIEDAFYEAQTLDDRRRAQGLAFHRGLLAAASTPAPPKRSR